MRSKDRSNKGQHEPIVSEELFDRVQEVRGWRAHFVKPGRPSDEYLLRKLLHCERCGARMHGTRGSRPPTRRYQCSTRRHGGDCDQPQTKAEPLEIQVVDWLQDFKPDEELRAYVLASLRGAARRSDDVAAKRRELIRQLNRLRDLYVIEDMSKGEYLVRRQAIEEQLERTGMPLDPRLDKAEEVLVEFGRKFWETETDASERRRLVATLIDTVWQDKGIVVAVKPREPFMRYFKAADELALRRARNSAVISGSDGTRTRDLRRDRPAF
jgi:Recombinase zinc beta ribbon domain